MRLQGNIFQIDTKHILGKQSLFYFRIHDMGAIPCNLHMLHYADKQVDYLGIAGFKAKHPTADPLEELRGKEFN